MADVKDLAYQDYLAGMKYKDIAAKHGVTLAAVKAWARRDWKKDTQKKDTPKKDTKDTSPKKIQKDEREAEKQALKALDRDEELTDKQRLFCIYWIKNKNATMAAIKAGYAPDSAHVEGSRLLRNAKVREYIELFISEVKNNVMIDTSEIVERYMKIAFADMTDFAEWGREDTVTLKDSNMVDGGLIKKIKQGMDGVSIELLSQEKALDWLAKYFMMNPSDKHKVEYDKARLELEYMKAEAALLNNKPETKEESNLIEVLKQTAKGVWSDE